MDDKKLLEIEHRLSVLEGWKNGTQSLLESIKQDLDDLKSRITNLERKFENRFIALDEKVDRFREELHNEIVNLDRKVDEKFTILDRKIDEKFLALDQKVNRFFIWMIGIQFGILLSIIMLLMRITL